MKNTFGNSICITLFGESHAECVGAVIDGLCAGIKVDEKFIKDRLNLRKPIPEISGAREEDDNFKIISGVYGGFTTGAPVCITVENKAQKPSDYDALKNVYRPSHADFCADVKYRGFQDKRGGGHFSGRVTAALVAAGAIVMTALIGKGIYIGSHISRLAGVDGGNFSDDILSDIIKLNKMNFALLDESKKEKMYDAVISAKNAGDSVGGILETAVSGLPAGVGEPWFDTLEGTISHIVFSVPAVKGIEFGRGFRLSDMRGSDANDAYSYKDGKITTLTNNSGGINGGISNGNNIVFRTCIKPTPSISIPQKTVDTSEEKDVVLSVTGRHDACIVPRARAVIDSAVAFAVADALAEKYGTDFFVL